MSRAPVSSMAENDPIAAGSDYRWLFAFCLTMVLITLPYGNYSPILPILQEEWSMSNRAAGLIHTALRAGYVISVLILIPLTDRYNARNIFLFSVAGLAVSNLLFAFMAKGFLSGAILKGLSGAGNGGIYMPGMRMVAERFPHEKRGRAIGFYVGAHIIGSSLSVWLAGNVAAAIGWREGVLITALGGLAGGIIAIYVLKGVKRTVIERVKGGKRREVFKNKPALLVITGYTAHNWELHGMQGWLPAFFTAAFLWAGASSVSATRMSANYASLVLLLGAAAIMLGGIISDRWGRTRTAIIFLVASIGCSLVFGWMVHSSLAVLLPLSFAYGFFIIGESAAYSTGLTEVVSPAHLGSAMAVYSFIGFTASGIAPWAFGWVMDRTSEQQVASQYASLQSWGYAFLSLGLVAVVGLIAMVWLRRLPESEKMAGGKR